jgi:hypothetical protein
MAKRKKMGRPTGRNPVIAVRVEPPLHEEIVANAKAAQRTMAAEIEGLLRSALENRKRFPSSIVAKAVEMATFAFLLTGERYAQDNRVNGPWWDDLESRRYAALAACVGLITNFVSTSAEDQALTVEALKGRIWTHIVNRPDSPIKFKNWERL